LSIEQEYFSVKDILGDLIGFQTTSNRSNLELIAYAENLLRHPNITTWRSAYPDDAETHCNLLVRIGPKGPGGLLISGHVDTVPALDQAGWITDPYVLTPSEDGEKLYGRGAADMLGAVACMLSKGKTWADMALAEPLYLLLSYNEEVGCTGIGSAIETFGELGIQPRLNLIPEPSGLELVFAHKSCTTVKFTVTTGHGHASEGNSPPVTNAVQLTSKLIDRISEDGELRKKLGHPLLGPASTEFTRFLQLSGGANVIPGDVEASMDLRATEGITQDGLGNAFGPVRASVLAEYRRRKIGPADIAVDYTIRGPGFICDDPRTIELAKLLAHRNDAIVVAYGTEAPRFKAGGHPEVLILGPGGIKEAHIANEFVARRQLIEFLGILDNFADFCVRPAKYLCDPRLG